MKKALLSFFFLLAGLVQGSACSCLASYYCEFIRDSSVHVAVQAKVIHSVVYGPDNYAVYMKVIKNYKAGSPVTDTIKVYGNDWEASCFVNVLGFFPVGDTVIVAFDSFQLSPETLYNPDSLTEHYTEVRPTLCGMVSLAVQQGMVYGLIHPGVNNYPLSHFQNALNTCDFSGTTGVSEQPELYFNIFPNPASDGRLYVRIEGQHDPIEKIRLFSIDGRLAGEYSNLAGDRYSPIEILLPGSGVHVLEIHISGKTYYRKAIML